MKIEEKALGILKTTPDDLAAYHSLVKVSIMRRDFNILKLLLMAGDFAQLYNNQYDYLSLEGVRNFIEKLKVEIFDQSFFRRGNIQKIELVNSYVLTNYKKYDTLHGYLFLEKK